MLNAAADNHNHMIGFNYDAAGNLTREGSGTPSWNYSWDAENRLSSISGSAADTFTYDGDGERVKKSNGALFWRQHGGPYLTKTNLAGGIISERILFNGLHVAILNPPTTVHYLFQDHLGGEHLVTDATGSSNWQDIDTLPFGSEIGYATSCNSSYRFAGMDRDYEDSAQLDYAINRYYDLRLGRFLSADEFAGGPVDAYSPNDPLPPGPLPYADIGNPQSLNKYSYTYNNPLHYIDPNGHIAGVDDAVELGVLVGAGVIFTAATIEYYRQNPDAAAALSTGASASRQAFNNAMGAISGLIFSKDAGAEQVQAAGREATNKADATIEKASQDIASFKNPTDVNSHIVELKEGVARVRDLSTQLDQAKGKAERGKIKTELQKEIDQVKGHEKELRQKPKVKKEKDQNGLSD